MRSVGRVVGVGKAAAPLERLNETMIAEPFTHPHHPMHRKHARGTGSSKYSRIVRRRGRAVVASRGTHAPLK